MRVVALVLGALSVLACGDNRGDATADGPPAPPDAPMVGPDAGPPQTLLETGLCVDAACTTISPGIQPFAPRWTLWSDGATKRRWIYLPPGTQIDTTDMNNWHFPQGTKLWKEFTRDGTRVETRLYWKQGTTESDWYQVAFIWNAEQDHAVATPGGMQNANGTEHDVPARSDCKHCHDRTQGRILGFSALQLDYDAPSGDLDLAGLVQQGALTAPPTGTGVAGPYFPLWPDATAADTAALGYMQANCAHCHNADSDVVEICPRIFKLDIGQLGAVATTASYTTTLKQTPVLPVTDGTYVVAPGDPDHSALYLHFTTAGGAERMPPLATEIIDPTGQQTLRDWIMQIPGS